ncbi:MAG: 50S ribosomal protein L11 methyltransferase [Chloroflexota bacterium]
MYNFTQFGQMIQDQVRMEANYQALKRAVRPGSVVVDIGAGTGIFSFLACQFGAARVYAIDPSEWIGLGKQMAEANGYADRIVFIKDYSNRVTLPEQADVVISDLRATHPIVPGSIYAMADARRRFLKPGGILIPQRDVVYAALIAAPELYRQRVTQVWTEPVYGLDLSASLRFAVNTIQSANPVDAHLIRFPGQVWTEIDYRTREDANASAKLEWTAIEATVVHFVLLWFDAHLLDEIGFTTAPADPGRAHVYGYDLLPLERPLEVEAGDQITLELRAKEVAGGDHIFSWNTSVKSAQGTIKAAYRQSTFFGSMLSNLRSQLSSKSDPKE